ncbi:MAG: AMP-binding protein, partial [Acidobacteria bacterium]|nr:AMP-binding protein [Acidobacteriota bacterium]
MSNFYNRFRSAAQRLPGQVAIELQKQFGPREAYTYAELRIQAEAVAWWLGLHHGPGIHCAILAGNGPRWVAAYLGILSAGCVAVPLDTALNAGEIRKLLAESDASLLFVEPRFLASAGEACRSTGIRIVPTETAGEAGFAAGSVTLEEIFAGGSLLAAPAAVERSPDDLAVILYTSGTTHDPKGVMLTHGNLSAEAGSVFAFLKVGEKDVVLGVLPLFHALAQVANLLVPLTAGARVVYLESLNTRELMRALGERGITLFCCVPQFFYLIHRRVFQEVERRGAAAATLFRAVLGFCRAARLLRLNLGRMIFRSAHAAMGPRMRYLISGGSRFDPELARDLDALGFEILQAYGLTESTGGAVCTPPRHNVLGSVGRPLPGVGVKLEGAPGSDGEILLSGGIIMRGYYKRPAATAEAVRDGWLYTGDLGHLDRGGNLFITGRKKEIIVLSSGKNIYPEEIESHYEKSPWIKEACVLGIKGSPNEPAAERLHAILVPDFELLRARKVANIGEMIRFDVESLSAQLPPGKRVLSYEIRQDDLPRTTTRKLKRFAIQARAADHSTSEPAPPLRTTTADDVRWLEEPEVAAAMEVMQKASK